MKNMEFHGIVVGESLADVTILKNLSVIGQMVDGSWVLYKLSVNENGLEDVIYKIQKNMKPGTWYTHFYNENGSKMVVVFKERFFEVDNNPKNWGQIIAYGSSLGIPAEQLDFLPNTFAAETY